MFGFGRRKEIRERARQLGETLHHLVGCVQSQPFDEFVEAMGRKNFNENFIDHGGGLSFGEKLYCFVEVGPRSEEFAFQAKYPQNSRPMLSVVGQGRYSGLCITGIRVEEGIFVDLLETAVGSIGRDARALQTELVQLPGFYSMKTMLSSLRGQ